jgi:beta-lactamase superfamily II metal-dependent hydrolase
LGTDARLQVLAVSEEGGVVFLLSWDHFRVLPIGDVGEQLTSLDVQVYSRDVNVVLLVRSGELGSNPIEWLAAANPGVILLSVDGGNRSGLPDAALLEMLSAYPILRTDINGSI